MLSNELVGKGETPYALNFGATFNDPTGPWLKVARDAVFGDDVDAALAEGKTSPDRRRSRSSDRDPSERRCERAARAARTGA